MRSARSGVSRSVERAVACLMMLSASCEAVGPKVVNPPPPPPPPPPPVEQCEAPSPGRVTLRRLNRAEYNYSVRDLLLDQSRPADDFPLDDFGYGFDNIGDVLSISPLLFEKYENAAWSLSQASLALPQRAPQTLRYEAETIAGPEGAPFEDWAWGLFENGFFTFNFSVEVRGEYNLVVRAFATQAGPGLAQMELLIDGESALQTEVNAPAAQPRDFTVQLELGPGPHVLQVSFQNDFYISEQEDRNLFVDHITIEGPFNAELGPNAEIYAQLKLCDPQTGTLSAPECATQILTAFARKAWRRPIEVEEEQRLLALAEVAWAEGDDFDAGITLALSAILLSPHFVFKVEQDSNAAAPRPLNGHELAVRLSYFLWSSTPDARLLELADSGQILEPETMQAQVRRMLFDDRAQALVDHFAGQWLRTRALSDVNPDYATFPDWDAELSQAMEAETRLFMLDFFRENRGALDIFDANFSYLNARLARHYGIEGDFDERMRRVVLPAGSQRVGLLTQGSLLTVTSQPRRTSLVKRGKWILTELLCDPPQAPPPGVEALPAPIEGKSLRERLEQHRSDPGCAACHASMDPLGFALERYDGIGAYREEESPGVPVDDRAQLPDGRDFQGAAQLAQILKHDPRTRQCIAERMMVYALGRGLEPEDRCALLAIEQSDWRSFESLITQIAASPLFLQREGESQ